MFMASDDNALAQATDDLIALYRSLERRTLDLPVISFAPLLIASLASLEFALLFSFALLLMIPVNLAILIRNVFPGHWQYRPFFFTQVGYVLRWIWRGEPPSGPTIFVRPLFNLFMKGHFDRRLRRLRQEVVLSDGLGETARSAILVRIDAALERWKTPRLTALFFTVILPAIIAIPTYYHQLIEFLASFGVRLPTDAAISFLSDNVSSHSTVILALFVPGYLLAIPTTAFLAKRGPLAWLSLLFARHSSWHAFIVFC
jgi:hypothetical protein